MNYKVILADDEPEVLRSIQRTLDWESYGFHVIGGFLNGRDVLDFLENQEADILFTDIRMPFMDGIELVGHIREKYPYMKLVIISGYDDFNYAREALVHGVLDYILKPINAKEMIHVIQRVRKKMDAEMAEKKNVQNLQKLYMENQPIIRENFLNRLVSGNIRETTLQEELAGCWIYPESNCFWSVALAQIENIEAEEKEKNMDPQLASVYIRSLIHSEFSEGIWHEVFYNPMGECILFGMKKTEEMERILQKLNHVARESRRVMHIRIAIGVGKIKEDLTKVKESFEDAKEALLYRKMSRDGEVIYMEDIDISDQAIILFDMETRNRLFTAVKFGKREDISQVIAEMKENLAKLNMRKSNYQAYCVSVLNALLEFVQQQNIEVEGIFGGLPNYLEILKQHEETGSFLKWLETQCLSLNGYFGQERENKTKSIIELAKKHIHQEYGNKDISLEKVAVEVGLTQTYFSSVFKKETGMSFVEYLTDVRMKEAMRLLKETDEKIYVVAQKVGYPESGYFSHVFKKKFGISPIQCRRQGR